METYLPSVCEADRGSASGEQFVGICVEIAHECAILSSQVAVQTGRAMASLPGAKIVTAATARGPWGGPIVTVRSERACVRRRRHRGRRRRVVGRVARGCRRRAPPPPADVDDARRASAGSLSRRRRREDVRRRSVLRRSCTLLRRCVGRCRATRRRHGAAGAGAQRPGQEATHDRTQRRPFARQAARRAPAAAVEAGEGDLHPVRELSSRRESRGDDERGGDRDALPVARGVRIRGPRGGRAVTCICSRLGLFPVRL